MTSQASATTIGPMAVTPRIVISLPAELLEALTEAAKAKGLARTAYIRMVLTEHVQETEERGEKA